MATSVSKKPRKPPRLITMKRFLSALFSTTLSMSPTSPLLAPVRSLSSNASAVICRVGVAGGAGLTTGACVFGAGVEGVGVVVTEGAGAGAVLGAADSAGAGVLTDGADPLVACA